MSVEIYAYGLVGCSVCASKDMSRKEIEDEVNQKNQSGINSRWKISKDKKFKSGEPNPCPCNHQPNDRLHYLMNC